MGHITKIIDPNGNFPTYEYDSNGDLGKFTDRENNATTFTYNSDHHLLTIVDARGVNLLTNEYDAAGRFGILSRGVTMSLENRAKPLQMDRNVPFVNEVFCILEGNGSEARAIELLNSAQRKHQLELSTVQPYPPPEHLPDELYPEYVRERLHGFWSTTHLILGAAHASRLFILFSDRFLCTMGLREWGGEVAEWANRTAWLNSTEWSLGDFTGGPNDLMISGYNDWSRLAMHLLTQKSKPRADVVKRDFYRLVQLVNQRDLNVDVRLDVVTTLASLGTPESKSVLEDLLTAETDERMVGSIKYCLSMIENQDKI